jgi:hypothetical protein
MSKGLRKHHYANKVAHLKTSKPSKWWSCVKELTGSVTSNSLQGIANDLYGGDIQELANSINDFFVSIGGDLSPLQPETFTPFQDADTPKQYQVTVEGWKGHYL